MGAVYCTLRMNERACHRRARLRMGNGDSAECHMPTYDFADEAIPSGVGYWINLVEKGLPAG